MAKRVKHEDRGDEHISWECETGKPRADAEPLSKELLNKLLTVTEDADSALGMYLIGCGVICPDAFALVKESLMETVLGNGALLARPNRPMTFADIIALYKVEVLRDVLADAYRRVLADGAAELLENPASAGVTRAE